MQYNRVLYREEGGEAYRTEEVPFIQDVLNKTGLDIGTKYEIRVRACNAVGCGPSSQLEVFRVGDIGERGRVDGETEGEWGGKSVKLKPLKKTSEVFVEV